jgi:hypothetical protein
VTTGPRGGLSQSKWLLAVAALIILAVSGIGVVGFFGSSKAAPATNSFVVSGALRGTLTLNPNLNCGRSAGGETQLAHIAGTLTGSSATYWTIVVNTTKNGTFNVDHTRTGHDENSVTLEAAGATTVRTWSAVKGSVTVDDSTGSFKVTAEPSSGTGQLEIRGEWECPA